MSTVNAVAGIVDWSGAGILARYGKIQITAACHVALNLSDNMNRNP
jgi:hypothetical protein